MKQFGQWWWQFHVMRYKASDARLSERLGRSFVGFCLWCLGMGNVSALGLDVKRVLVSLAVYCCSSSEALGGGAGQSFPVPLADACQDQHTLDQSA